MNPSSDSYSEVILVQAQENNPNPVHLQGSKWDQMGYCVWKHFGKHKVLQKHMALLLLKDSLSPPEIQCNIILACCWGREVSPVILQITLETFKRMSSSHTDIRHRTVSLTPPTQSNQLPKPATLHITQKEHSRIPRSLTQKGWVRWNSLWGSIPQWVCLSAEL